MKSKRNIRIMIILFTALFAGLIVYLPYSVTTYGSRWFTSPYNPRLNQQRANVIVGDILDRNGVVLATTGSDGERAYNDDRAIRKSTSHVVGDSYGLTVSGVESLFARELLGFDAGLPVRIYTVLSGQKQRGSSVEMTIDAKLTDYASDVISSYRGSVVVMNYKTGEILCSLSHPTFDPENVEQFLEENTDADQSALVNRATMGRYTPGSVYKIITAAAALKYIPDINSRAFECEGPLAFDSSGNFKSGVKITPEEDKKAREAAQAKPTPTPTPTPEPGPEGPSPTPDIAPGATPEAMQNYLVLRDYASEYHDEINFKKAFAQSCNVTFARLGMELGTDRLDRVARQFGVGDDFIFSDMILYPSSYTKGTRDIDIAWSAAGQYKDIVTPLHMCMISASIANGGAMMEPRLVRGFINNSGLRTNALRPSVYKTPLTATEAQAMQELMFEAVKSGTGTSAAISKYKVGGKTGTAEVSSDKKVNTTAWFAGFVYDDDHPLAIAIVLENAGTGGSKAAPAAKKILSKAISLGY